MTAPPAYGYGMAEMCRCLARDFMFVPPLRIDYPAGTVRRTRFFLFAKGKMR